MKTEERNEIQPRKKKMTKKLLKSILAIFFVVFAMSSTAFAIGDAKSDSASIYNKFSENENCISGTFVAREDGEIIGELTLYSNCTFKMVEYDDYDNTTTRGTYSIEDELSRGYTTYIEFFVNGESYGTAFMAWPMEGSMFISINGFSFDKQ